MPETEQRSEIDRLRAFELRMQTEGAAGFADGLEPWNNWRDPDHADDGKRAWGSDREREAIPADKTLCEKMLSAVATVAVAALAVGIGGVYLSSQSKPQVALDTTQPAAVVASAEQAADPLPAGNVVRATPEDAPPVNTGTAVTGTAEQPLEWASAMPGATVAMLSAVEPPGTPRAASGNLPWIQGQPDTASASWLPQAFPGTAPADIAAGLPAPAAGTATTVTPAETVLPAPAASTGVTRTPKQKMMPAPAASTVVSSTAKETVLPTPAAGSVVRRLPKDAALPAPAAGSVVRRLPKDATLPAPAAGPAAADTSTAVSMVTPPAAIPPARSKPALGGGEGPWVVNISSYNFESMARRKLGEFKDKGVNAEIHPVTIKGKPMFRIRATGYESRAEAKTWLSLLQDRLDVDSAWVSKR
ncbi:MAG: SPOR domain-containing protein [Gammaproteobacteria bacterium]